MPGLSYEPHMQWLRMSNGLRSIFQMAGNRWLQGNPGAAVNVLIKSASSLLDPDPLFAEGRRVDFAHLLGPVKVEDSAKEKDARRGEEMTTRR